MCVCVSHNIALSTGIIFAKKRWFLRVWVLKGIFSEFTWVYFYAKFEVSSIIVTSFRQGNPPTTSKRTPKKPTQIRAKVWKLFLHSFIVSDILVQKLRRLGWRICVPPRNCRARQPLVFLGLKMVKHEEIICDIKCK